MTALVLQKTYTGKLIDLSYVSIEVQKQNESKETKNMAKDPVCGMKVDEGTAKFTSEHSGKMFYFCSQACKAKFDGNPMKYMTH